MNEKNNHVITEKTLSLDNLDTENIKVSVPDVDFDETENMSDDELFDAIMTIRNRLPEKP